MLHRNRKLRLYGIVLGGGGILSTLGIYSYAFKSYSTDDSSYNNIPIESHHPCKVENVTKLPTRQEQINKLKLGTIQNPFDILIIGGGATGAGTCLDAASRYK